MTTEATMSNKDVSQLSATTTISSSKIFERVGIIMDNGKPKFRLGEPAFSMDLITPSYLNNGLNCDNQESSSFVVLGKSSMEFKTASLADYEQIQDKSMAIDCPSSFLATLTHCEIENKVTELMQENTKLKETLAQNNVKMKQQFNTLVNWQEELKELHENHKQKFTENRTIIELLKKENAELRIKISTSEEQQHAIDYPTMMSKISLSIESINHQSNKSMCDDNNVLSITDDKIQLKDEIYQRDIHYLQEINESLKKQLAILSVNLLIETPLKLNNENLTDEKLKDTEHYQRYIGNLKNYQKIIDDLGKSYAVQTSRYIDIQNYLKQAIDSLEYCDGIKRSTLDEKMQSTLVILQDSRNKLINQQLKNIQDRKIFIKIHNQFKKILSDYNLILDELKILDDEKSKFIEEQIISAIRQQSNDLERDKSRFNEVKYQLEKEKQIFIAEKQLFELNKESLEGEKASLDLQSQLYEAEMKILQDNAKVLEIRNDDLKIEISNLKVDNQKNNEKIKSQADEIQALQAQVESYKCDFEEETRARKNLLQNNDQLTEELVKSNAYKQDLLQKLNGKNIHQVETDCDGIPIDIFCNVCGSYKMPGQWHGHGFCQPID